MFDRTVLRAAPPVRAILLSGLVAACNGSLAASNDVDPRVTEVRNATARYQDFNVALAEGYTHLFMDMCMVDDSEQNLGGMGFHYVNLDLLDDALDVTRPEAVMYETGPDGRLVLVGVEYVIPGEAWTSTTPPQLLGESLALNDFDLWALHVWSWKENPSGTFASWNPTVSCD